MHVKINKPGERVSRLVTIPCVPAQLAGAEALACFQTAETLDGEKRVAAFPQRVGGGTTHSFLV